MPLYCNAFCNSWKRPARPPIIVPTCESVRAQFHAAMRLPVEARAAIAEARKADPKAPGSYVTEGLLGDRDKRPDDAKAAYAKAVDLGSTSAYAHYRLASLLSQANASRETYTEIERLLAKAVELDIRFAAAYAFLGDVRTYLGNPAQSSSAVQSRSNHSRHGIAFVPRACCSVRASLPRRAPRRKRR